jgi:putative SOS response-associated peptidase YedK
MCGRYLIQDTDGDNVIKTIIESAKGHLDYGKLSTGEIYPTNYAPVIKIYNTADIEAYPMIWGFSGFTDNKHPKIKPKPLINAKAETIGQLKTWKESYEQRRCLVPSSGFYEWRHEGKNNKTKYLFTLPDKQTLFMAGVYKTVRKDDNTASEYFSIITTSANTSMQPIHNRMPVVLYHYEYKQWLTGDFAILLDRSAVMLEKKIAYQSTP